jgi:hypothetical protein
VEQAVTYADTKLEEAAQQDTGPARARRRYRSDSTLGLVDDWHFRVVSHHPRDRGPFIIEIVIMSEPSTWRRATTEAYSDGSFKDGWFERMEQAELMNRAPRALPQLPSEKSAEASAGPWGGGGWPTVVPLPPKKRKAAK